MNISDYIIIPLFLFGLYYLISVRRTGMFSVDNIFIIMQLIIVIGTLNRLDYGLETDNAYAKLLIICVSLFIFGAIIGEFLFNKNKTLKNVKIVDIQPDLLIKFTLVLSIFITLAYYQSVGYNTFFLGLSSIFSGESYDIATLRLESYAGSRYLFPGYVNQFKNAILPGLSIIYIIHLYKTRYQYRHITAVFLLAISLIGVLGTGQRGAFVVVLLVYLGFAYFYNRYSFRKYLLIAVILGLPTFFASSVVLDRNNVRDEFTRDPYAATLSLSSELTRRIFNDNQVSGIVGYRYIAYKETQNGREWLEAILGILPGERFRGSTLAGEIFQILYGSTRGTSPIGLWGSVFYNFGLFGIYIFPILLALIYKAIYSHFSKKLVMNYGQLYGMIGIFITLGTWVADGPVSVLNTGLPGYLIIYYIFSRSVKNER